jgi:glycosyltransferase involved in cell wall biosynthesis
VSTNIRIPQSPPIIDPVSYVGQRPLWSVMIPAYNCSEFLAETITSVIQQAPSGQEMQIEVVDDASTDADIESLVYSVGKGRVSYYRQSENVGSLFNFQTCINRANGNLIHILHGDDKVKNGFYSSMTKLFNDFPSIAAGFCRYAYIDESGKFLFNQPVEKKTRGVLDNALIRLCERQKVQYVSMVVRREVYETVGSFYGVDYGEDWEMWTRIAEKYPIGYRPEVLAEYRMHTNSISGKSFSTAHNMECLEWVMNKNEFRIPEKHRSRVMRKCKRFYSHYAVLVAKTLWTNFSDKEGANQQIAAALRLNQGILLHIRIAILRLRMLIGI